MAVRRVKRLPLEQLAPYLLEVPPEPSTLDWRSVFGNDHPVEIEVGFGKGLFLLTSALSRPGVNFLGLEIERKCQLYAAARMAKRSLANVRLAHIDARHFLRDRVHSASIQALHVYFPDPWWKTRHRKRRVFTPEFARECARVLCPGGRLWLATDVPEYFEVMTHTLARLPEFRQELDVKSPGGALSSSACCTNFERKAREQGRDILRAVYRKEVE